MTRKYSDPVPCQYMRMMGHFKLKATFPDGRVEERSGKNLITAAGESLAAGLMDIDGSSTAPSYIAFGSGSASALKSDTQLQSESADARTVRTSTTQTNNVLELAFDVTVASTFTLNEMGIFNAATGGIMVSRFLTQALAVVSGVVVDVTWTLTFSGVD